VLDIHDIHDIWLEDNSVDELAELFSSELSRLLLDGREVLSTDTHWRGQTCLVRVAESVALCLREEEQRLLAWWNRCKLKQHNASLAYVFWRVRRDFERWSQPNSADDFACFFRKKVGGCVHRLRRLCTTFHSNANDWRMDTSVYGGGRQVNQLCFEQNVWTRPLVKEMRVMLSPFIALLFNKSLSLAVFLRHSSKLLFGRC